MKAFFFVLTLLIFTLSANTAFANGPWNRFFQDAKFPSQAQTEHQTWVNPAAASASLLGLGVAINSGSVTTISTFAAQPDFARNITLTPTGTTANVGAGTAVVSGLNIYGKAITENFTIGSAQSTATVGAKAFKSVSSVVFPAATGAGVSLSIGSGSKLGLPRCLTNAGDYAFSEFGGAYEVTRGTVGNNASAVESNTFIPNGSMDGAHNVDLFYIQNFRCYGN